MFRTLQYRQNRPVQSASLLCLLAAVCALSGCQVGRTWFQMDSNSPMPFFGFDLLPGRKTSQRTTDDGATKTLVKAKLPGDVRPAQSQSSRLLNLPKISDLVKKNQTEEISFEAPPRD